jgi:putative transposase
VLYFHQPGEAQVSPALGPEKAPAPWTQRSLKRTHRHGRRDETTQPPLRLPQDRRADLECLRHKDVVRRILLRYYRAGPDGGGPSWLSVIGQARDRLWSVDLFRTESILLKSYWITVVMDVYTRRIVGFGVAPANLDGIRVCRMFNRAIARQTMPRHLSSDHDPLFRFHRWRANLRILEVDEIKTIPATLRSHVFVERLIGTIRGEYLDRIWFWNHSDLERKLEDYKVFYNQYRCHTGLTGATPAQRSGAPALPHACFDSYRWQQHCYGLFQTPAAA